MQSAPAEPNRIRWLGWGATLAIVLIALIPWWRNHHYLRDFYDYGLVISAVGLIEHGQRPYVDFTTPIQAGFLALNWLGEKAGGGTYQALTNGAAGLIVALAVLLPQILRRRWPWWLAALVGLAITVASASQHTILWHNALGVGCLAVVAWSGALAPVVRRADRTLNVLLAGGLFLGGVNKMNFHLVALAAALAWALRAGLRRQAGWPAVLRTGACWLVAGALLPVAAELAWTGASLHLWWYDVVGLAGGSRLEEVRNIWSGKFLLQPLHDYYGRLLLPQTGLAGLVISLAALVGCWPGKSPVPAWEWDRVLLPVAVILSSVAGAALLATNQDIAWLGLGAWFALAVAVWLGFAGAERRVRFLFGLALPALVLGVVAWISAWQGQRSQFGYSASVRGGYRDGGDAGPGYAYLRGTKLPPEIVQSLRAAGRQLPPPGPDGHRPVFYATGTEWLDRMMPGLRERGQPLWMHWGTTYGPREALWLARKLVADQGCRIVLTTLARDYWAPEIREILHSYFDRDLLGPVLTRWTRRAGDDVGIPDSIAYLNAIGGSVAGTVLRTDGQGHRVVPLELEPGRILLGIMAGEGRLKLATPTHRFSADAVVARARLAGAGPLSADFQVLVGDAAPGEVLWSSNVVLPAGQDRMVVPFNVDPGGRQLVLAVKVPPAEDAQVAAGYRNLNINDAVEIAGDAPRLRPDVPPNASLTGAYAASLFVETNWRPRFLNVRGGRPAAGGLQLDPGGEIWLHTDGMQGELFGEVECPDAAGIRPTVRVVWYKGGRLQLLEQGLVPGHGSFAFRAWTAEPGGRIGILLDRGPGVASALVRIIRATITP